MKVGSSSWSFVRLIRSGDVSLIDFVNKAKELGLDAVELLDGTFPETSPEYVKKVRKAVEKNGLEPFMAISGGLCAATEEQRKAKIKSMKDWTQRACDIGVKVARVTTGMQVEGVSYTTQVHWVIDGFKECAEFAEKCGITYAIENHDSICRTSEGILWIIDAVGSDHLRACPDAFNYAWETPSDKMIYMEMERIAPFTAHLHAKMCDFNDEGEATNIDHGRIISIAKETGFDGCVSMEIYGDAQDNPVEAVTKGAALIRKYI